MLNFSQVLGANNCVNELHMATGILTFMFGYSIDFFFIAHKKLKTNCEHIYRTIISDDEESDEGDKEVEEEDDMPDDSDWRLER